MKTKRNEIGKNKFRGRGRGLFSIGGAVIVVVANCALRINLAEGLAQPKLHQLQNIGAVQLLLILLLLLQLAPIKIKRKSIQNEMKSNRKKQV